MSGRRAGNRRDDILQTLAAMLEQGPGVRITTAALARELGVSEAALYRHFPSKARMFEGLLDFVEETLFSRMGSIVAGAQGLDPRAQAHALVVLVLTFAERNPGISRLLTGDALAGETERLRARVNQFHDRIETQLRTLLRTAEVTSGLHMRASATAVTSLMMNMIEGRMARFVRTHFRDRPLAHLDEAWAALETGLFQEVPPSTAGQTLPAADTSNP